MIRTFYLVVGVLLSILTVQAQLTLQQCHEKARSNYPLIKQLELLEKTKDYTISNVGKAYLPQVSFSAKATYQSDAIDVTLPIPAPAGPISLHQSKDQYQIAAEVNQLLWDGGTNAVRKKLIESTSEVDKQKVEVELYALRDRIHQLFFGLLLLKEQATQLDLMYDELQTNLARLQSSLSNGVIASSDIDLLKVEILSTNQKRTELKASQKAYRVLLSALIGEEIQEGTIFVKPISTLDLSSNKIQRPELQIFNAQIKALDEQRDLEFTNAHPKVGLFLQGGYGRPGFNMLSDAFSAFYIGGVRMSLSLSSLNTRKNTLATIQSNKAIVNSVKETFLLNNSLKTKQYQVELEKLKSLIDTDNDIVLLRTRIKEACASKLSNGVSTMTDLLREINAESIAKQQKALHEIQYAFQLENFKYQSIQY